MRHNTDLRAHALAYARAGLPVLPLVPHKKTPLTEHGKDDATLDLEQIDQWWSHTPAANIGVRPPEDMVVLDVDPRNGGHLSLRKLQAEHGFLPATWTAETGGGGLHVWLWHTGERKSVLAPGIDLKDHRGYLVMPPSVHPNGTRYEWLTDTPIARCPAWLAPLLRKTSPPPRRTVPRSRSGKGAPLLEFLAGQAAGNRNASLYWAASKAAADGLLTGPFRGDLIDVARGIGLSDNEIRATIASAERQRA